MKILAVDTATQACSAALFIDGETTAEFRLAPREHTQLILPMVESLLQQAAIKIADLDALAFGRGPGSFTGVRIATGIVQGLAFAHNLPVLAISTLASIAQLAGDEHQHNNVLAGIDARMGEIYWGCYQRADNEWPDDTPGYGAGVLARTGRASRHRDRLAGGGHGLAKLF